MNLAAEWPHRRAQVDVALLAQAGASGRLNPCELEIDLFCQGMRIDSSCTLERDARFIARTRAGLGSGLEIVIPGPLKDIWVNVPVEEDFAQKSHYLLVREPEGYFVVDERHGPLCAVRIPPEPAWYTRRTSRGTPMHRVGILQGTYLAIYISNSCGFWYHSPPLNCKFCTTGLNVGVNELASKNAEDVVEVARAAKEESGVTFVHFNSGYQTNRDLDPLSMGEWWTAPAPLDSPAIDCLNCVKMAQHGPGNDQRCLRMPWARTTSEH